MCGKTPKVPTVIQRDPIAEQRIAEATAQLRTNSETANRRRRRHDSGGNSMTAAARAAMRSGGPQTNTLLAQAKPEN